MPSELTMREQRELHIAEELDKLDALDREKAEFIQAMKADAGFDKFMRDWKTRREVVLMSIVSFRADARQYYLDEQEG